MQWLYILLFILMHNFGIYSVNLYVFILIVVFIYCKYIYVFFPYRYNVYVFIRIMLFAYYEKWV